MSVVGLGLGITASANFEVAAEAEIFRKKLGVSAVNDAQVDTAQSKFGSSSLLTDRTSPPDYLSVQNDTSSLDMGSGDWTVEFFMRPTSLPGAGGYHFIYDSRITGAGSQISIGLTNQKVFFFTTNAFRITGATTLSTNTMYHVALVKSGGTTTLYLDGTSDGTYSDSNTYDARDDVRIGANFSAANGFSGNLDEFRISNSARYTTTFTPTTEPFANDDNTKLLLHMNGTDGSTFFEDDNGVRAESSLVGFGTADIDTAQSKFSGTSFYVDGSGGDGVLAHLPSNPTAITIEGWYRFDGIPSSKSCMFAHNRASTGYGARDWFVTYNYVLNDWSLNMKDDTATTVTRINSTANDHEDTNWHHLAICMEIGGYARLFIDGDLEEEVDISGYTFTDWTATGNKIWLGHWYASSNNHECYYDEFRISDSIRYTTSFTAPTAPFTNDSNTIMLLHADGTNGSQVFRDDNGTGRSAVGVSAEGNAQVDTAQSEYGGASALFDGTGDYLKTTSSAFDFGTGDFTIECWVRSTVSGNQGVWQLSDDSGDYLKASSTSLGVAIRTDTSNWNYYSNGNNASLGTSATNTWYHIALVRNSGTIDFYVDGTSVNSEADTNDYSGVYLAIGGYFSTSFLLTGNIDEFRISDTARYTAGFTPPTEPFQNDANTLLLLHMDGTDGSTVFIDDNGKQST